jgi:hypothetical protein
VDSENAVIKGGIGGIAMASTTQKVWRVSQALGDIAFAYPFTLVLLEIEDTLKSPPPETETMKTTTKASILVTTFFYISCGCIGYAAFGDAAPGNLLTGFGFYEPYWLIDAANLCIVLHLLGGYQVYTQPVFAFADRMFGVRLVSVNVFRLCFRTAYVAATTALAVWFPYFNQVIGLLGPFTFWPLGIHLPVEMYLVKNKVAPWTKRWLAIRRSAASACSSARLPLSARPWGCSGRRPADFSGTYVTAVVCSVRAYNVLLVLC